MRQKAYFYSKDRKMFKVCLENRFAGTKLIKSQLQDANVDVFERTLRTKLKDLDFTTCRRARKLTAAMKAKHLKSASALKAHLKFSRIKLCLCVVVMEKNFNLTVPFRLLSTLQK
ncbi:unnamed protein product [Parnassius mnemosyne]|uniref:Uncharacterized protein n=1 Tax=Parnassius mnemosyne TaxID=213953 RepID=A0AAV1L836_9NEOP